ncbi:hypothetical protein DLM86_10490 [Paenibacillus flagellatus]|uniref:Uncharacterized protein n=2 Tax=Paenibacillus flagellatus TaxID=2211139 RepID=A0A2V5KTD1_9BACL|nr:hypothetical protein DLM86_10490 [Paenibacillus flagellatus]
MGAFLLGGIVGAAAVVYWNRNRTMSFAGLSSQAGDVVGKVVKSAAKPASTTTTTFDKSADASRGLDKVEELIQQDPTVKKQVDEILDKSDSPYMTQ